MQSGIGIAIEHNRNPEIEEITRQNTRKERESVTIVPLTEVPKSAKRGKTCRVVQTRHASALSSPA
ncbi:hypothetical protein TBK1r_18640 [Stieleria magnilauensis]|uniref:Uncharacterized protein n=1 Tax=Stieleria magnilauensis TaxID=2527963 RepID=A0ABX5XME8_9BACT|nr:hypothetical protein TBK1r_18640 [Planctomycetes bacterium TBK1r]